jgi:hypothetical protein
MLARFRVRLPFTFLVPVTLLSAPCHETEIAGMTVGQILVILRGLRTRHPRGERSPSSTSAMGFAPASSTTEPHRLCVTT